MNYQEMSDRSIDLAVFQAIFGKDVFTKDADLRRKWERGISYCNSWADAGPIIQEEKIDLTFMDIENCWCAEKVTPEFFIDCTNHNPLRAAMVVFLMMKGGE